MKYLMKRNGWYTYNRHIPAFIKEYDKRNKIQVSLNTKCEITAIKQAIGLNDNVEAYWKSLLQYKTKHSTERFKALVKVSKQFGFTYKSHMQLPLLELRELISRIIYAEQNKADDLVTDAVFGKEEPIDLMLSEALIRFWDYSKPKLINKNADQQRKWRNPRIKAVNNFIKQVGDKPINNITNLDMIKLRDWWLKRMEKEDIKADTINKDFTHLKGVIETVSTHEQISIEIEKIFKKVQIKETNQGTRTAYSSEFIRNEILNSGKLDEMEDQAKCILHICIETGARPIEIVNLIEDDIHLNAQVPYIYIKPRKGYSLKTQESERKIPLIGNSLNAFKAYPKGFDKYKGKSDKLTSYINKYLARRSLRPTRKHSLYSFRHSFQNRLNELELPDRIQCQLMGHKFKRPKYGDGASLEHLRVILLKSTPYYI